MFSKTSIEWKQTQVQKGHDQMWKQPALLLLLFGGLQLFQKFTLATGSYLLYLGSWMYNNVIFFFWFYLRVMYINVYLIDVVFKLWNLEFQTDTKYWILIHKNSPDTELVGDPSLKFLHKLNKPFQRFASSFESIPGLFWFSLLISLIPSCFV